MKRFALAALMVCVASVPILSAKTAKKSAPKNTKTTAAKKVTAKKQPAAKPAAQAQSAASAKVGDAYAVKRSGNSWAIGTDAVEVEYTLRDGRFLVTGFTNKKTAPAKKYVTAANPVDMGVEVFNTSGDDYSCDALKTVKLGEGADSAEVSVDSVEVKKGDKIGMVVDSQGEYSGDHVEWGTTVTYTDGDSYNSADDVDAAGLEVWGYYAYDTNSGGLVLMEDRLTTTTKQRVASPTQASGYRVGPYEPFVGSTQFHPSNGAAAVRVFTAPKDGIISVRGNAKRLGTGGTDVKIAKLVKRDNSNSIKRNYKYTLVSAQPSKTAVGGSSCVRLDITMNQTSLEDPADTSVYRYHVTAFPKTGVLRQWADIDNKTKSPVSINPVLQNIAIKNTQGKYTASWMTGETVDRTQGLMYHADLGKDMGKSISATASAGLMPWMGIKSGDVSEDGIYTAPDYMGTWNILANRGENGNIILSSSAPDRKNDKLQPGTSLRLPYVAFGVFAGGYDDMMRDLYTWQYTYLWDYTHIEWFAKTPFTVAWYGDSDNCAMKFCGHLGQLDMDTTDEVRTAGMDVLWEDAGWSAVCHWWDASFEGPDFALTRRYLEKNGMKLLVWMQGHQTNGLTSSKVASWGNIQRRTDGMGFSRNIDIKLRYQTETFLDRHPRASFHTCSGGSNYSHLFEIQRYTDVNYDADGPAADYTNAYWSYAELPDKWFDNMNPWGYPRDYEDNILWRMLTQVPKWGLDITDHELKEMALIVDLYKYLLKEGVAGRWSFMPHPVVKGDEKDYNYGQRMNYDGTKGIIVLKDTPKANVTVYPRGLVGNKTYLVQCEKQNYTQTRVGKDLMMNGVDVAANTVGEIIYLNLPGRPRGKSDTVAPSAPDTVYAKRETNIGFAGMGIYWSAAKDNNYISYYEVKRGDTVLGVAGTGHYYFDRTEGWSETADYYVRTVDGDRNVSEWKLAKRIADEPDTYTALGGHYKEAGRRGWKFETTKDEITFTGSTWVKPVKAPGADKGGTTIQEGGAEGWWAGEAGAKAGRGWMQASESTKAVKTWTAPKDGTVTVVGKVVKDFFHNEKGQPVNVKITHNAEDVWGWKQVMPGDLTGLGHDLKFDIAKGDTVRFYLDYGKSFDDDVVDWLPVITYVSDAKEAPKASVIRINCGSNANYTDNTGKVWSADKYATGGAAAQGCATLSDATNRIDDANLYKTARSGKFSYKIPVAEGIYRIRVKFAEPKYADYFKRPFNVSVNGFTEYRNFDICHSAKGMNKPYDALFNYVVPQGGFINLAFDPGWEPAMATGDALVNAIEITPEDRVITRINCGSGSDYIDWNGNIWKADNHVNGGTLITGEGNVQQATPTLYDQELVRTARSGKTITYVIPMPDRLYSVHLKFAELWLKTDELQRSNTHGDLWTGPKGKKLRPVDISINGKLVAKDWDMGQWAEEDHFNADLRFDDIVPDKDGNIVIKLVAKGANDAVIQGIEIE